MATTIARRTSRSKLVGTSLKGITHTTYKHLVEVFGVPTYNPYDPLDAKGEPAVIRALWVLEYPDGIIATVYDWKQYGTAIADVMEWNVGGNLGALELVEKELGL